jgi:hypothetical protein
LSGINGGEGEKAGLVSFSLRVALPSMLEMVQDRD